MSRRNRKKGRGAQGAGSNSTKPAAQPNEATADQPAPPPAFTPDRWVEQVEIAERLGKDRRTLYNWRKAGKIPLRHLVPGGPLGMTESEFVAFLRGPAEQVGTDG